MSEVKRFEYNWAGRPLVIEIGEVAKQANGACLVKYGDSTVLSCAVSNNVASTADFFPLMVLYQEKLYAAGKIPGGFLRREGRATEHETLVSRLIDRPIRPLFAEGFNNEVQVINTVLSSDPDCTTAMAAMLGSSIALMISDIPFEGPIAGVVVGKVNGELIINPTPEQLEVSDINLTVAGTHTAINMVEAGARFVSEDDMWEALKFGHAEIQRLCEFEQEIVKECGKEKYVPTLFQVNPEIEAAVKAYAEENMIKAIRVEDKLERYAAIDKVNQDTLEEFGKKVFVKDLGDIKVEDTEAKALYLKNVQYTLDEILHGEVRRMIAVDKIRPDGRAVDEIRPLSSRVDVLPRVHGSALFTRGQTQSLGTVTLGSLNDNQIIDGLSDESYKRFMLHYNFPQFSVGETGRYGAPGRREIGHGALGERALSYVIPSEDEFPYTIRVVSEILESNGSSSQATICSGTLALMAAGVPIKAPVAGIAMGLIMTDDEHYTVLTDIQGMEDHLGDMDFKVAGTRDGITALQMDIKIKGITYQILKEALAQAKKGRLQILDHMATTIAEVRPELSPYAPKVVMARINPDKIKDVIGSGGKTINATIEKFDNVKIDLEQDGRLFVMHQDMATAKACLEYIKNSIREAEVGAIYTAKVTRIEKYGIFCSLWEGAEGLCHISKLALERVEKPEDVVSIGDEIIVKCIGVNEKGQIDLSRKDALKDAQKRFSKKEEE
ncbi:polyribonucleotide nucleotidyltransferase [Anaeroplasma bactoclasticum]|jgi:polyribonucleotide nucleotidyltransferase|uniref:Polyribonucleotide nucleotidyltransferase n=1 Tax=Anaeroplasma bactoclasticum TaxID=2088 RepID=A0A397RV07_9MOLU|nr:polyribonucleotide nucleotidyltransferase [Anaeroplasma bactoclasticum]RIA75965.1 polyribonucleotide nucleotidyltransferase [Anaeroplasma bactoclasticum]